MNKPEIRVLTKLGQYRVEIRYPRAKWSPFRLLPGDQGFRGWFGIGGSKFVSGHHSEFSAAEAVKAVVAEAQGNINFEYAEWNEVELDPLANALKGRFGPRSDEPEPNMRPV